MNMSEEFEDAIEEAIESWNEGLLDVQLPTSCYYQLRQIIAEINRRPNTEVRIIEDNEVIVNYEYDDSHLFGVEVDTWPKFHDLFCFPFVERCKDLVQNIEVELDEIRSSIKNLRRSVAFFRKALDINNPWSNSLETELIQNNIKNLEERASEIQMAFVEMEKMRWIFPELEESRLFNNAWWIPL